MNDRQRLRSLTQNDADLKPVMAEWRRWTAASVDLVMEKALAHCEDPKDYPVPADANQPETKLARALQQLGPIRLRKLRKAFEERVGERTAERNQHYGHLAQLDLRSSAALTARIKAALSQTVAKPAPPAAERLKAKLAAVMQASEAVSRDDDSSRQPAERSSTQPPAASHTGAARRQGTTTVVLELQTVRCQEKTREAFEGKDEIDFLGFPVSEGVAQDLVRFTVGKFKEGDSVAVNRVIATLSPQALNGTLSCSFFLQETDLLDSDRVGVAIFFDILKLILGLAALVGFVLLFFIEIPAAVLVLMEIGGILAATEILWSNWLFDDRFELAVTGYNASFDDPVRDDTFTLKMTPREVFGVSERKGKYELKLRWAEVE